MSLRRVGALLHGVVAVGIMCACVHIMQSEFAERASFGRQLSTALAENQFELYLQPQVDLDGTIHGAEALLRWNHPRRGLVPPGDFIPAAEQLGIMRAIGKWVIETACARLALWELDPARAHLRIAVNVSAQQFHDDAFVPELKATVARHHIDPRRLELELTESVVVSSLDAVVTKMEDLVAFGVGLSLDDFGTGYSSLKYLKRMPFSQIKIDQSFVRDMMRDERDVVIVKGIIQLGRELNLEVIAEGVETSEQRDMLAGLGCGAFQGYLFGRPAPADEFPATSARL